MASQSAPSRHSARERERIDAYTVALHGASPADVEKLLARLLLPLREPWVELAYPVAVWLEESGYQLADANVKEQSGSWVRVRVSRWLSELLARVDVVADAVAAFERSRGTTPREMAPMLYQVEQATRRVAALEDRVVGSSEDPLRRTQLEEYLRRTQQFAESLATRRAPPAR